MAVSRLMQCTRCMLKQSSAHKHGMFESSERDDLTTSIRVPAVPHMHPDRMHGTAGIATTPMFRASSQMGCKQELHCTQQSAPVPCSAPSAAERTACLGPQSCLNSSGITFSSDGSVTCGAVLRHTVSVSRAASDTWRFEEEEEEGLNGVHRRLRRNEHPKTKEGC
jgi:hypothetical protein